MQIEKYFPYSSFRRGQKEIAVSVYQTIEERGHLIIEGPSGLGKTAAVLAGALPHVIENNVRLLFLARTHRELERIIDELRLVSTKVPVSGVSLRGKLEMCTNLQVIESSFDHRSHIELCNLAVKSGRCEYYTHTYEKSVVDDFVRRATEFPVKASDAYEMGKLQNACPYELIRILLPSSKIIAVSYMYLVSPIVIKNFIKNLGQDLGNFVVVIDEAHNLPDFSLSVLSDVLSMRSLREAINEAERYNQRELKEYLQFITNFLESISNKNDEELFNTKLFMDEVYAEFGLPLNVIADQCRMYGEEIKYQLLISGKHPRSYMHRVGEFLLKLYDTVDQKNYIHIINGKAEKRAIEITALDPREAVEHIFKEALATISMSGTMKPLEAYTSVVGIPKGIKFVEAPSPFPEEQVLTIIIKDVTTKYELRETEMYERMSRLIAQIAINTPGNTGVFAASYEVQQGLLDGGLRSFLSKPLFIELQEMSSKDNDRMLQEFKMMGDRGGAVLLSVQGGRNSEGEDYPGSQMDTVIVVGVPFAKPSIKLKAQIDYYDGLFPGKGKSLAYLYPAIRKAAQAAGRPFRLLSDRGVIILMDSRFLWKEIKENMPSWIMKNAKIVSALSEEKITRMVRSFYKD
ncbi:MAG: helicase C-terminal domain-containing protein [Thermoprotei archaeon]